MLKRHIVKVFHGYVIICLGIIIGKYTFSNVYSQRYIYYYEFCGILVYLLFIIHCSITSIVPYAYEQFNESNSYGAIFREIEYGSQNAYSLLESV